jgi:riboflavin kinase/FMN adenylyltransferase
VNCQLSIVNCELIPCVATIGSFDGVHRGHRSLLSQVRSIADERGLSAVAVTFRMSPKRVLGLYDAPQLTTLDERVAKLREAGMDDVALLDFSAEMAAMSAHDFMQQVLKERLGVAVLVIGYDHRFGRDRSEGFDDYVRYGSELGIEVVRGEVCMDSDEPVSSTRVRGYLAEGRVAETERLLGYKYTLCGKVVDGYKVGRKMGFPTANIQVTDAYKLLPADGVYAVWVAIGEDSQPKAYGPRLKGMLNIGYPPTLNNGRERSIEVHILDFEGDLYGKSIKVEFVCRLRDELPFDSLDELTIQLQKDRERVSEMLDVKE